jgi:hypothetical protein
MKNGSNVIILSYLVKLYNVNKNSSVGFKTVKFEDIISCTFRHNFQIIRFYQFCCLNKSYSINKTSMNDLSCWMDYCIISMKNGSNVIILSYLVKLYNVNKNSSVFQKFIL